MNIQLRNHSTQQQALVAGALLPAARRWPVFAVEVMAMVIKVATVVVAVGRVRS